MVLYNFKKITVVPKVEDFVDMILSQSQLQPPTTLVHERLLQFYMRKIKTTHTNIHDKLSIIINEFPTFDQIHPYLRDLIGDVLYKKDDYDLALDQVITARNLITEIANASMVIFQNSNPLRSMFIKSLNVVIFDRMCFVMKRIKPSLVYLEQIRQHMAKKNFAQIRSKL